MLDAVGSLERESSRHRLTRSDSLRARVIGDAAVGVLDVDGGDLPGTSGADAEPLAGDDATQGPVGRRPGSAGPAHSSPGWLPTASQIMTSRSLRQESSDR